MPNSNEIVVKTPFDKIRKNNGEKFAKAIRNYDNGIFDVPNIVDIVKYAGRDAEPIMMYLVSLKNVQIEEMSVHRDPIDMLSEAGYDAYVADTFEKQNAIQKYFAPGEELCTFRDPHRFENYYIINAVRKDVDSIQRAEKPQREDKYGTSVISIQVSKNGGFISIKNRYNHTVLNPDNTLNSNPDNIIVGLSDAIKHYFDVDFSAHQIDLPDNYTLIDDKICKYNQERDNVYYGDSFYIEHGRITDLKPDKERLILIEPIGVFDLHARKFKNLAYRSSFDIGKALEDTIGDKKIQIIQNADGSKTLTANGAAVFTVKNGLLQSINTPNADKILFTDLNLESNCDFSHVQDITLTNDNVSSPMHVAAKLNPRAKKISLSRVTLNSDNLDFSGVESLTLYHMNLANKPVKLNKDAKYVQLLNTKLMTPVDLSGAENIELSHLDYSDALQINPNAESVKISFTDVPGTLDLHNVKNIYLPNLTTFYIPNIIFNPNANTISIEGASQLPSGDFDFSNVKNITLYMDDVSQIKFNPNADSIDLQNVAKCPNNLDFSHVKELFAVNTHFNNCKFNPNADDIFLRHLTLFGDVDFSNVKKLHLEQCDLSNVTSIKFPQNAEKVYISNCTGLRGRCNFGGAKSLTLEEMRFTGVTAISFAPGIEELSMENIQDVKCNLDFSKIPSLQLYNMNVSNLEVKFNPNAEIIKLDNITLGARDTLDFRHAKNFISYGTRYDNVRLLKINPNAEEIRITNNDDNEMPVPLEKHDFHNTDILELSGLDFGGHETQLNPNAKEIRIYGVRGLAGLFDFSNVEYADLVPVDINGIRGIKFPKGALDNKNEMFRTSVAPDIMKRLAMQYSKYEIETKINQNVVQKDMQNDYREI